MMGWLTNSQRRALKEQPLSITDQTVQELLQAIDSFDWYVSPRLGEDIDRLVRMRDKALISTTWLFFKRGGEVLRLKRRDMFYDDSYLYVTFAISKKLRRYKQCKVCSMINGAANLYCRGCGSSLEGVEVMARAASDIIKTKRKTLRNPFTIHVLQWLQAYDKAVSRDVSAYLFPALTVRLNCAVWRLDQPMTIQNFDRILQRLNPALTSCLFRYGGAEKYLMLGYSPYELKEIGDWETSVMPEIYARRKGLTEAQRRWSNDYR